MFRLKITQDGLTCPLKLIDQKVISMMNIIQNNFSQLGPQATY